MEAVTLVMSFTASNLLDWEGPSCWEVVATGFWVRLGSGSSAEPIAVF